MKSTIVCVKHLELLTSGYDFYGDQLVQQLLFHHSEFGIERGPLNIIQKDLYNKWTMVIADESSSTENSSAFSIYLKDNMTKVDCSSIYAIAIVVKADDEFLPRNIFHALEEMVMAHRPAWLVISSPFTLGGSPIHHEIYILEAYQEDDFTFVQFEDHGDPKSVQVYFSDEPNQQEGE
jgi:hypothetical protein